MAGDIRIETGFLDHPKTVKLCRRIGPTAPLYVMRLWLWVSDHHPTGWLGDMDDEAIEIACRWEGEAGKLVAALVEVGFVDGDEHERQIHEWMEHQPWVAKRNERKEQARNAASARWHARSNADSMPAASDQQSSSTQSAMPPTQPNPTQTHNQTEKAIAPSAPAKRASQMPDGFDLTDEMRQFAREHGVADPAYQFAAFCDYHRSKGSTFKDWPAAWRTWCRNAKKFGEKGKAPPAGYLSETRDDLLAALNRQSGEVQ